MTETPRRTPAFTLPRLPGPHRGLAIGLFGGSFDPAHSGHLHVAATALEALRLDCVWWLPAVGNPLKNTQTPFSDRIAQLAHDVRNPRMRVSRLDADLHTRYTAQFIRRLKARAPDARFVFVIGEDNLATLHRWRDWPGLLRDLPVAVVSRPDAHPKAALSKAARRFASARIPQEQASTIARRAAPAWVLLHAPLNPMSSTRLRRLRGSTMAAGPRL